MIERKLSVINTESSNESVQDHNCFVCNAESKLFAEHLMEIKSEHSQTSVCDLIKQFLGDDAVHRSIEVELFQNSTHICSECISRINEYDLACVTAERIGNELRELLLHTDSHYSRNKSCTLNEVPNVKSDEESDEEPDSNGFGGGSEDLAEEGDEIRNVAVVEIKVEDSCVDNIATPDVDVDTISDLESELNEAEDDVILSKNGTKMKRVYECQLCPKKFELWKEMRVS